MEGAGYGDLEASMAISSPRLLKCGVRQCKVCEFVACVIIRLIKSYCGCSP